MKPLIEAHAPALIKHLHGDPGAETGGAETTPRLFRELITAFELLTNEAPVVITLDDAHWLDEPDVDVIHAGTAAPDGRLVTAGGRVLAVTAVGADVADARAKAYEGVSSISFPGAQWRTDIARHLPSLQP